MKKLIISLLILFSVFLSFSDTGARTYWETYIVEGVTDQGIVLKDFEGKTFLVDKKPNQIKGGPVKAGDAVRYDAVKNKMMKSPWQPAKITEVGNNSISIELLNGDAAEVNMKSSYRDRFKKGDHVQYQASRGKLKKSNIQSLD